MHSHLAIKIDGQELALKPDLSIDFEEKNPLFNDAEMFSYPFEMPFDGNRVLLKNMDDVDSDLRPVDIERKKAVVYAEGLPVRSGVIITQENETLESGMSMNIDASTRSFDDLIGDLECRDVPLKDELQIGEKIGNVHVVAPYSYRVKMHYQSGKKDEWTDIPLTDDDTAEGTFEPQALGFSCPSICQVTGSKQQAVEDTAKRRTYPDGKTVIVPKEVSERPCSTFINVSAEYGNTEGSPYKDKNGVTIGWPFCNARVCYKHMGLNEDGTTSDSIIALKDVGTGIDAKGNVYEDNYPYWVLDADRQQSGLCFYVLYFLDCLFAHLGVQFDKSALLEIEDMKHLCFFTTHCKYDSIPITDESHSFYSFGDINNWLNSRGCGGKLSVDEPQVKQVQEFKYEIDNSGVWETVKVGKDDLQSIDIEAKLGKVEVSANVCKMIANSDNFPDAGVKEVLDSLEASFGIRFNYDYEKNKVTAYLLRSVFRSTSNPVKFQGEVREIHKMSEKITGFRMKYDAEGTAKEQADYVRRRKTDYDTDYDYIEYPADRLVIDKTFAEVAPAASATNMKVYVDLTTGNAYRFKVDNDTLSQARLFEVGALHGIEMGQCSTEYEDYVKEYVSSFQPVMFNLVNFDPALGVAKERSANYGGHNYKVKNIKTRDPMLVAFVDEEMEHEFVEQKINNVLSNDLVDLYLTETLSLIESYDPSDTDDGNSPLQQIDWGMAVAMMRGGGTNMEVQQYDYGYDGFNNSRWRTVAGEYALTSDTMDQFGTEFDYNGIYSGIGDGERFSLKICAYKPFRYKYVSGKLVVSTNPAEWSDASWLVPCNADIVNTQTHKVETKIRSRGLFDTFMSELCYFLLHRKKYKIKVLTTIAQLADIPNHWRERYDIGGKIGYINKVNYSLQVDKETREAEIEFYAI